MNLRLSLALIVCLACVGSPAQSQSPLSSPDYYGRGVHAFFSGNSSQARQDLTMAIGNRPNDPRPYYFRALCNLRTGWQYEAEQDMEVGAALEAQNPGTFAVGQALQRVQGGHRLTLERYRTKARASQPVVHDVIRSDPPLLFHQTQQPTSTQQLWRPVRVSLEQLVGNPAGSDFVQQGEFQSPSWIGQPSREQPPANAANEPPSLPAAEGSSGDPFRDDSLEGSPEDDAQVLDSSAEAEAGADDSKAFESKPTEEVDPFGGDVNVDDPFGTF